MSILGFHDVVSQLSTFVRWEKERRSVDARFQWKADPCSRASVTSNRALPTTQPTRKDSYLILMHFLVLLRISIISIATS